MKAFDIMKGFSALAVVLSVSACSNFSLGMVHPYPGATKSQMSYDVGVCRDAAYREAGTSDKQAAAFLMGLTIVGAPVAYEMDKATQRAVFRDCMWSRGYAVTPAPSLTD